MENWKNDIFYKKNKIDSIREEKKSESVLEKIQNNLDKIVSTSIYFIPAIENLSNLYEHQNTCYRIFDSISSFVNKYNLINNIESYAEIKDENPKLKNESDIINFYLIKISNEMRARDHSLIL